MGYTHYWYRIREIPKNEYRRISNDFKKLLPLFKVLDIQLGNGLGVKEPVFKRNEIAFNGLVKCGHKENKEIVIPWPAQSKDGIPTKPGVAPDSEKAIVGQWFAGVTLNQRTCNGDCSYETFSFPRVFKKEYEQKADGTELLFDCCKTAYRPYDLAVTAFLIIAKRYLGGAIKIHSDGEIKDWQDAMDICENALGYGKTFKLDHED
jgi:hypothetical protein